tara:strand:+ start:52 stop:882 length:831 start_codon:yes stop_codon:yes gene_type:complete
MKPTLLVSFSGGRTSAYMTKYAVERLSRIYDVHVVFANTGEEHENTLDFVNNCDKHFGFNTVWVEADVIHGERTATKHKVVTYETASRNGEPFEEVIKKYGVPNLGYPHCTRELKLNPIHHYMKTITTEYITAIGIRADETRRVSKSATKNKIIYPLVDMKVDKEFILDWWKEQPFDLNLEEREGNCKWCWKKSDKKHMQNIHNNPEWYDFPNKMEEQYSETGGHTDRTIKRYFFRQHRSTKDMFKLYDLTKGNLLPIDDTESGGCSESCELYTTD